MTISRKVNKKVKKIAFYSALATKAKDSKILVFEALAFDAPKTKDFAATKKAGLKRAQCAYSRRCEG